MENNYVVYMHTLKCDGRKYIGITCQKPKYRWKNGKGYTHNEYFTNAIKKYGWDSFKHEIVFENLTKEQACSKEKALIKLFKTYNDAYGFNYTLGGESGNLKYISESDLKYQYLILKKSINDCAIYFGVSRPLIVDRLHKLGIITDKIIDITKESLVYQYITLNKTQQECANYFNCSRVTIKRLVNKFEIKKEKAKISETVSQAQIIYKISYNDIYQQYIILDQTRKQCAKYFNCGKHIIDRHLKKYKIKKNRKGLKRQLIIAYETLYDLYIKQNKTLKECREIFNCSKSTIIRWLKEYNISKEN